MALDSFSALKTAIADTLNRSDLTSVIPDFITLAEARIKRVLRTSGTGSTTVAIAAADTYFSLPATALEILSISVSDAVYGGPVSIVSYPALLAHRAAHTSTGAPLAAHIVGDVVQFSPTSNAAYNMVVEYEGPFTALSDAAPSNAVLVSHPDLYLYGALAESAPYLKDDARIPVWEGRFQKGLQEAETQRNRRRWPTSLSAGVPRTFTGSPPGY